MFSGKREKALLEEELAALRETEKRERELLHKIAGQKDTAEEQFARMTASRAQMEKEIEEIEQQMQQNGELSENGAQAAGELHNTLITMNNGIATFDANHSVFMEQVKGQNEKVVEIVENNKHFTTPMKHISEAPQALREMRQALGERAERMEELSKTMGVLALNSAIEAGRMGESGTRFVTAAEQVRAYADDYEQEALALKAQLGEAEERITSLEEQVHHLNELLKENNISMGKLYRDCAQNMVAYETGQIGLREQMCCSSRRTKMCAPGRHSLNMYPACRRNWQSRRAARMNWRMSARASCSRQGKPDDAGFAAKDTEQRAGIREYK